MVQALFHVVMIWTIIEQSLYESAGCCSIFSGQCNDFCLIRLNPITTKETKQIDLLHMIVLLKEKGAVPEIDTVPLNPIQFSCDITILAAAVIVDIIGCRQ